MKKVCYILTMLVILPITSSEGSHKVQEGPCPLPIQQKHDTWCAFAVFEMLYIHITQCWSATQYMLWRDKKDGFEGAIDWDCCNKNYPCQPMVFNDIMPFYNNETGRSYSYWLQADCVYRASKIYEPLPCLAVLNYSRPPAHAVCLYKMDFYTPRGSSITTVTATYIDPWYGDNGEQVSYGDELNYFSPLLVMATYPY